MACPVLLRPENDWVHQNYVCMLVKETDWVISLQNIFCRFLNFPPDFYQHNWDSKWCSYYQVYWVNKLSDYWNLYKKESTSHELTLYLPSVEIMVTYILWWLAIIFIKKFCLTRFCNWETFNIQTKIVWSCSRWGTTETGLMVLCVGKANISFQCCCLWSRSLVAHNNVSSRFYIFIMDSKWP